MDFSVQVVIPRVPVLVFPYFALFIKSVREEC